MKPHFNNDKIGDLIIHVQTKNLIELDFSYYLVEQYAVTLTAVTSEFFKWTQLTLTELVSSGWRWIQVDFLFFRDGFIRFVPGIFLFSTERNQIST